MMTRSSRNPGMNGMSSLNPITLRFPLESIVCFSNTFDNNLGIKQKFIKYLKESCCVASKTFLHQMFSKNAVSINGLIDR